MTFDVVAGRSPTPPTRRTPPWWSSSAATTLGTFPLDNTIQAALPGFDATGTTSVDVVVPAGTTGPQTLILSGATTGTESQVPITIGKAAASVNAIDTSVQYGRPVTVTVNVGAPNGLTPTGTVTVRNGGTTLGTGTVSGGVATVTLPARSLPVGTANLTAEYSGDANLGAATDSFTVSVSKATSKTKADVKPNNPAPKQKVKLIVEVEGSDGVEITGKVKIKVDGDTITRTLKDGN